MSKIEARQLRLLFIDDNPPLVVAPAIEVTTLESLKEVQQRLIQDNRPPADLIVCDVNMAQREKDHPEGITWGEEGALPGYGPLLALPFLRSDAVCEFVPASSYWPQVRNDGYVLVSVALMLSAIARKPYRLREAQQWIDEQESPQELVIGPQAQQSPTAVALGTPEWGIAVSAGLVGLRRKLTDACELGRVTIAGLETTLRVLRNWKNGELVEEDGAPACIEVLYADRSDCVAVNSVFADVLSFAPIPNGAQVDRIVEELEEWLNRGARFQSPRSAELYEQATQLLTNRLPTIEDREKGARTGSNHLKDKAKAVAAQTGIDSWLLIRTAIIFAFLRAWYFNRVLEQVCDDEDGEYSLLDWAYWFLDIHPRRSPTNRFKRLLAQEVDGRIEIGPEWHRRGFDEKAMSAFDAYTALEQDKPLSLTPGEKSLGRRFIADADRFFPEGVNAEYRKIWKPDKVQMAPYPAWLV